MAYDVPHDDSGDDRRDVFLRAVDGSGEIAVADGPWNDERLLGWARQGKKQWLLFRSPGRHGGDNARAVRIEGGAVAGAPVPVIDDIGGRIPTAGCTDDGLLYYTKEDRRWDLEEAELDPVSGELLAGPREIKSPSPADFVSHDYSADGKAQAFSLSTADGPSRTDLVIRDLSTAGADRFSSRIGSDFESPTCGCRPTAAGSSWRECLAARRKVSTCLIAGPIRHPLY